MQCFYVTGRHFARFCENVRTDCWEAAGFYQSFPKASSSSTFISLFLQIIAVAQLQKRLWEAHSSKEKAIQNILLQRKCKSADVPPGTSSVKVSKGSWRKMSDQRCQTNNRVEHTLARGDPKIHFLLPVFPPNMQFSVLCRFVPLYCYWWKESQRPRTRRFCNLKLFSLRKKTFGCFARRFCDNSLFQIIFPTHQKRRLALNFFLEMVSGSPSEKAVLFALCEGCHLSGKTVVKSFFQEPMVEHSLLPQKHCCLIEKINCFWG